MNSYVKKVLSIILSFTMVLSLGVVAFAQNNECDGNCRYAPTIVVPGIFQSEYKLYENGEAALNSDNEELEQPFFLPSTGDIVKLALKKALVPLLTTLICQKDVGGNLAKAIGDIAGELVMNKIQCDNEGNYVNDVRTVKFNQSIAQSTEEEKNYIYGQIPIHAVSEVAGEDHVYFFAYGSLGNMIKTVDELYSFIQQVKAETGHDKVNLVPISQGGSVCVGLLEFYPDVVNDLNRVVYVVPALNGSYLIGELFENGLIDDDEALYSKIFPILCDNHDGGLVGYIVNLVLRLFPNEVINSVIDVAVDSIVDKYKMKNSTLIWGLCSSENYLGAAEKYLSDSESAEIRRQTDLFYQAQLNRYTNIQKLIDAGVEVFDIVDYNYSMYPLVDSWEKVNADGIIQLDSESMGATSFGVNVVLPDDYTSSVNNCNNPQHDHSDPMCIVDPLTGLIPCKTFYFYNADHERTARNDVLISLVCRLCTDESFTDVYSDVEMFPQFNGTRVVKNIRNDLAKFEDIDYSQYSESDAKELQDAVATMNKLLNSTIVNGEEYKNAENNFYYTVNKIVYGKSDKKTFGDKISEFFNNILLKALKGLSNFFFEKFGGKGYSEIFKK